MPRGVSIAGGFVVVLGVAEGLTISRQLIANGRISRTVHLSRTFSPDVLTAKTAPAIDCSDHAIQSEPRGRTRAQVCADIRLVPPGVLSYDYVIWGSNLCTIWIS
jgi:hypothetical protein